MDCYSARGNSGGGTYFDKLSSTNKEAFHEDIENTGPGGGGARMASVGRGFLKDSDVDPLAAEKAAFLDNSSREASNRLFCVAGTRVGGGQDVPVVPNESDLFQHAREQGTFAIVQAPLFSDD